MISPKQIIPRRNSMDSYKTVDSRGHLKITTDSPISPSPLAPMKVSNKKCVIDPSAYVSLFPIIPIPTEEWMKSHIKACSDHVAKSLISVQKIIEETVQKRQTLQNSVTELIKKNQELLEQRLTYKGRGLKENRSMFYLICRLYTLKIKFISLSLIDIEKKILHFGEMRKYLSVKRDFSLYLVSVNIRGFSNAIPNNFKKIKEMQQNISLFENYICLPKFIPPPEELKEQLIYPTSSTAPLFTQLEKNIEKTTYENFLNLLNEFHSMTNENDELKILIDLAFSYAWRATNYPFLPESIASFDLPSFQKVRTSLFLAPNIPEKYEKMHICELVESDWPYKPVVDHLMTSFFLINPIDIALVFFEAMGVAGRCVTEVCGEAVEIDFDTIFPLMLVCVLVSGILNEPKLIHYVANLGLLYKEDSTCQLGASYAEAIIKHLSSLDEQELLKETEELDKKEKLQNEPTNETSNI
ncbi:hypothetical protein TRFO_02709 [Tritrichomonas foetus]|uniref:VPS9 domain-containing protein n=1 Tax=Tritrichomonas foetus TaxID=1144522 RepID=A0A1J4L3B7_9EUKA|nr:hypothetical protein TRFO_02709 [Tritrichomonas foetus]|eukprot:OHT16446.1 hypothetical protein TRFO_02709 [Tritrichomonas foetus]